MGVAKAKNRYKFKMTMPIQMVFYNMDTIIYCLMVLLLQEKVSNGTRQIISF